MTNFYANVEQEITDFIHRCHGKILFIYKEERIYIFVILFSINKLIEVNSFKMNLFSLDN